MDVAVFHAINGLAGHAVWFDRVLKWLATYLSFVSVALVGASWFWPGTTEARGRRERLAVYAVVATLVALGIAQVIGQLWFRERPYIHHSAHLLLSPSADPSFPSDHAIGAFALAVPFLLAGHRLGRWLLGVAVLLCLSRVAVGTHYPSDVAAGALLGAGVAAAVWGLRGWVEGPIAGGLGIARRLRLA